MRNCNNVLKNKYIILAPVTKKNINKTFIKRMNQKVINKFLVTKNFTNTSCVNYFEERKKNGDLYYSIFSNLRKKYIGTITLQFRKKKAFIGNVIYFKKEHGSKESKLSFNIFLDYCFKKAKINKIYAGTNPRNYASNFNLLLNNFKIIRKNSKEFNFILNRKDYRKFSKYQII